MWRRNARTVVPLAILVYTHNVAEVVTHVPTFRIIEYAVCQRFYLDESRSGEIPELECKAEPIQKQVLFLLGWFYAVDCFPGILTAFIWGHVADKLGRRFVMALSCTGQLLFMVVLVSVAYWNDRIPTEAIFLAPVMKVVGGGTRIFDSMTTSVAADITTVSQRTNLFYALALLMSIANVTAPPFASWTLSVNLWLPFWLSGACFCVVFANIIVIPDTRRVFKAGNGPPESQALLNEESLRRDVLDPQPGVLLDENATDCPGAQWYDRWRGPVHKILQLTKSRTVVIFLLCSVLRKTAIFSENFFVQYTSERFKLRYSQTAWFEGLQAAGAMLSLGAILPGAAHHLQRRLGSPWKVDLTIMRISLAVMALAYMYLLPDEMEKINSGRWTAKIVNLWRPLAVVRNAPLVITDKRTVPQDDLMEVEKVLPDKVERSNYV
ncbi:hypothetical protein HMPREF1624_08046 [Sporothrix schenckii ATCC 58251]|uniref:Major facilitator superfamily (MFS) profile domain-containing protein n=1 Tax=Sporothrix schenckii (strain ATCC 58251 / de Perez 2211183) TaxID=1391915 RepID=U7PLZ8_SPOS1|nr:hypothetical protein HMPREF1624_08046 [Sporothrix schenckii ATCC 58251]